MRSCNAVRAVRDRLGATALALALACAAGGAHASTASVVINGFEITTSADPSLFVFAPLDLQSQTWGLNARDNGGAVQQSVNGSVADWSNVNETAQTPMATATVSSSQATDPFTQLATPIFTLAASATGANNAGFGSMLASGGFCFGDGAGFDGTSAGCNAAGVLTATVYYDLLVNLALGDVGGSLANAGLSLHVRNGDGSVSTMLADAASTDLSGSIYGQIFTFTLALAAGESAYFDLSGTVRAAAVAVSVPEPGGFALLAIGLLGLAAVRQRRDGLAVPGSTSAAQPT